MRIAGETTLQLPTLSVPDPGTTLALSELREIDAIRLFLDRAAAADPAFHLDEHNAAAVTEICRRLDGIPLAIELAAARVRGLPVDRIAARLNDRFKLLTGGDRTALKRQQTLARADRLESRPADAAGSARCSAACRCSPADGRWTRPKPWPRAATSTKPTSSIC